MCYQVPDGFFELNRRVLRDKLFGNGFPQMDLIQGSIEHLDGAVRIAVMPVQHELCALKARLKDLDGLGRRFVEEPGRCCRSQISTAQVHACGFAGEGQLAAG